MSPTLGTFSLGVTFEVKGIVEFSGFSGARLVKPDPTLSASSSESPP